MQGFKLQMNLDPLPSDWRYREDLLWLLYGDIKMADSWKDFIEATQRVDRKARSKFAKKHK